MGSNNAGFENMNTTIKNGKLPFLFFACLAVSLSLLYVSNGREVVSQEGWEQKISELEPDISFMSMEDWLTVKETYRRGVLTLQLEHQHDGNDLKLIITVLPIIYSQKELISEAQKMLESSLYKPQPIQQVKEAQEITNMPVIIIDTTAGGRDVIYVRSAGFTKNGHSYFITALTIEDQFPQAINALNEILVSIDFEK
jgi:hypothetical protein